MQYSALRAARPGLWLLAALVTDLVTYTSAHARSTAVLPWLLLDLWLTYRTWRGGGTALAWFRGLQLLGVTLLGLALASAAFDTGIETATGPVTVVLYAVSLWCLMSPALTEHVTAGPPTAVMAAVSLDGSAR